MVVNYYVFRTLFLAWWMQTKAAAVWWSVIVQFSNLGAVQKLLVVNYYY